MKIYEIKKEREAKQTILFKEVGLFWAFSNEQFSKNKTPLQEGEKYVSIGAGGYLPKSNLDRFSDGMKEINKWFKTTVNANKDTRRSHIAYELANHEAYYTGSIEDTLNALGSDYKAAEVQKVYDTECKAVYARN